MKEPVVSIVMPCYNHEKYVEEAIQSIYAQSYPHWELIVIDDCSQDKSVEIIQKYLVQDSRIRLITHSYNKGTSATINDGIKASQGMYIALQSADDMSTPLRLEKQVAYLNEHPDIVSVSTLVHAVNDAAQVDEYTKEYEAVFCRENITQTELLHDFFIYSNYINNSSQMIPRRVIDTIGLNKISLFQLHDYDYNIRLALEGPLHIFQEKLLLYRVRDDGNNVSLSNTRGMHCRQLIENYMVLDNYLQITDVDVFLSIFGKYAKRIGTVRLETIPYFLSLIAIQHCTDFPKKLWGFRTLYQFLKNEAYFEILRKDCGLTYSQFTQLVKRIAKYFNLG